MKPPANFSLVTAHFGSDFWIRQLVGRVNEYSAGMIAEIIVIDQNRGGPKVSLQSQIPLRILRFPKNDQEFTVLGHDHPSAIQRALLTVPFRGENIIVLDSDCLPLSSEWATQLSNVQLPFLAGDPAKWGLTHPCLMVLPAAVLKAVNFSEGVLTVGIDTGRLVGHQLASKGHNVVIDQPLSTSWGRGNLYMQETIYHHGSGSLAHFQSNRDGLLRRLREELFHKMIEKNQIGHSALIQLLTHLITLSSLWKRLVNLFDKTSQ